MSALDFDRLLAILPALPPDQLRLLRERVEAIAAPVDPGPPATTDEALQHRLIELGIMTERKPPRRTAGRSFTPITITGEPLSETVLRERR